MSVPFSFSVLRHCCRLASAFGAMVFPAPHLARPHLVTITRCGSQSCVTAHPITVMGYLPVKCGVCTCVCAQNLQVQGNPFFGTRLRRGVGHGETWAESNWRRRKPKSSKGLLRYLTQSKLLAKLGLSQTRRTLRGLIGHRDQIPFCLHAGNLPPEDGTATGWLEQKPGFFKKPGF